MKPMQLRSNHFRHWLEAHDSEDFIGKAKNSLSCPIATYLHERTEDDFVVATFWYRHISDSFWTDLPEWAYRFVEKVDKPRKKGQKVTATEALAILDEVLR